MIRRTEHHDHFRFAERVIIHDDLSVSVLMVKHRNGLWILPGGGPNEVETFYSIQDREVWEETGLDISGKGPRILVCAIEWFNDPEEKTMQRFDWVFAIQMSREEAKGAHPRGEITDLCWLGASHWFCLSNKYPTNTRIALRSFSQLLNHSRNSYPELLTV